MLSISAQRTYAESFVNNDTAAQTYHSKVTVVHVMHPHSLHQHTASWRSSPAAYSIIQIDTCRISLHPSELTSLRLAQAALSLRAANDASDFVDASIWPTHLQATQLQRHAFVFLHLKLFHREGHALLICKVHAICQHYKTRNHIEQAVAVNTLSSIEKNGAATVLIIVRLSDPACSESIIMSLNLR